MEGYQILKADRSWANESNGKDMYSCIAKDGVVVCYFPTKRSHDRDAERIKSFLQESEKSS